MAIVRRIGVVSLGKVMGCLYALIGLIIGGFVSLIALAGVSASGRGNQGVEAVLLGAGAIVLFPFLYGIIGFIGGIIVAALYNLVVSIVGGIEVELQDEKPRAFSPVMQ